MNPFNRRNKRNDELNAEIASHIEMSVQERIERGESTTNARAAALREFGNVALVKETTREIWGWSVDEQLRDDVRYALRTLRKSPAFTVAATTTLALGIGAATVIFSVADHVAFRPLPYPHADRLFVAEEIIVEMRDKYPALAANASHYLEWKRSCTVCDGMAAVRPINVIRLSGDGAEQPGTVRAAVSVFPLLGAKPHLGRLFTEADERTAGNRVVLVSYNYWMVSLGGDSSVVGKTLQLNNEAWMVIGVLSSDFSFPKGSELAATSRMPAEADLFIPLVLTAQEQASPGGFDYAVIGRLAPHATLDQARTQLNSVQRVMSERSTDPLTFQVTLTPLQERIVGASGNAMLLLLAAVASILLIVCVNLANLLLARHASRARESTVRVALGAKSARLVRQALTESVVLALLGGSLGILLSYWGLAALLHMAPADTPRLSEIKLDGRIIAIAAAASLVTGLIFGVFPALRFGRVMRPTC